MKNQRGEEKRLERIVKGFANHWRIRILRLLAKEPELSVEEITEILDANAKTIGSHLQRLAVAGLIMKRYEGRSVRHKLTPLGKEALISLRKLG